MQVMDLTLMTKPCDYLIVIPKSGYLNHASDPQVSPLLCVLILTLVLMLVEHALNDV